MIEVKPGNLKDLLAIDYDAPLFSSDNRADLARTPEQAEVLLFNYSWILYKDDVPIAAMGIVPKWDGVAYGWAILSSIAKEKHPLSMTKMAKDAIRYAEEYHGIRRIEVAVLLTLRPALRWIRALGFKREGKAHCYGPGALGTVVLFSRVV